MDTLTPEQRSQMMSRVRSKHTVPERIVRSLVHRMGFRFSLHRKDLPGKPDLTFPARGKVIFVHGCFWHLHQACQNTRLPKSNVEFWKKKLENNRHRDRASIRRLRKSGWKVMVAWECQLKNSKPAGARKGGLLGNAPTTALAKRIGEHANTIAETENLTLEDFNVRHLAVDAIWIPLGEALMIDTFAPAWNKIVKGFGIHTPGKDRANQCASPWDTLHPGRPFVTNLRLPATPKSQQQWIDDVRAYLRLPRTAQVNIPTVETGDES